MFCVAATYFNNLLMHKYIKDVIIIYAFNHLGVIHESNCNTESKGWCG